jgi:hypothetical protein
MKTAELTGAALDWAVANCLGYKLDRSKGVLYFTGSDIECCYSSDWDQGGPVIESKGISIRYDEKDARGAWNAVMGKYRFLSPDHEGSGPTPLVAGMRCFVASECGDEIEIPEELL